MKKRLNHSRYIDNGAKDIADNIYEKARTTPTAKQVKFYKKLYAMCKENNIDCRTEHEHTRAGYSMAIDTLLKRLQDNNIDVRGNGKSADYVLRIGEDEKGRAFAKEYIEIKESQNEN